MANGWVSVVNWRGTRKQSLFLSPWASTNCPCPLQRSRAPSRLSCPSSRPFSRETTTDPALERGRFCYCRETMGKDPLLLHPSDEEDAGLGLRVSKRSVSYTHLRAHETRHDLVCRLLL